MLTKLKYSAIFVSSVALLTACGNSSPSSMIVTELALASATDKANKLIGRAEETGDRLIVSAAVEGKNAIAELEAAYGRQLQITSDQGKVFMRNIEDINVLLDSGFAQLEDSTKDVQALETNLAQVIENTPLGDDVPYITHISDHLLSPVNSGKYLITIQGVNIQHIEFSDEYTDLIDVHDVTETKFVLEIDAELVLSDERRIEFTTIPIALHGDKWMGLGSRKKVDTEITFAVMPLAYATYTYEVKYIEQVREERRVNRSVTLEGKNTTKGAYVRPSDGWTIDLEQELKFSSGGGIQGRCKDDDINARSENGIKLLARLDHMRSSLRYLGGRDGIQTCSVSFVEYRLVPTDREFTGEGVLMWNEDEQIKLPSEYAEAIIELSTFDGVKRIIPGTSETMAYVDVKREHDSIILTPKTPRHL